jgi:DNA modification methylase
LNEPVVFLDGRVRLYAGDCIRVLAEMEAESVHAIVTDPPYGLEFMGKGWDGADGFRRSLNEADAGRDSVFGRTSKRSPEYRTAGAGVTSKPGIGARETEWVSNHGWNEFRCETCGLLIGHGGSPCQCEKPRPVRADNRWPLFQAFMQAVAVECLRVLKPGGHLVAFGGTRTYHRLACAIEDAGFEIRDCVLWHYGSGFPKSRNVSKALDDKEERCSCHSNLRGVREGVGPKEQIPGDPQSGLREGLRAGADSHGGDRAAVAVQSASSGGVRSMRNGTDDPASLGEEETTELLLQPIMPRESVRSASSTLRGERQGEEATGEGVDGGEEPRVEGRRDLSAASREPRRRSVRPVSSGTSLNGSGGRLRDGAPVGDGEVGWEALASGGGGASPEPSFSAKQQDQSGTMAGQQEPQDGGAWPLCGGCGKPIVPDGLGTALKPATELICIARKPLIGTVAENVLKHGTGAINIDACRVEINGARPARSNERSASGLTGEGGAVTYGKYAVRGSVAVGETTEGRWPANLVHDGSEEVLAAFPRTASGTGAVKKATAAGHQNNAYGKESRPAGTPNVEYGDEGSAARFFYTAKADADDRIGSKHPTVKPVDLMRWLVRLVTPPGGTILDPFAGTGTTGEAAYREGFNAILIEREPEYQADIARRMALCKAGPAERKRAIAKVKARPEESAGPLFGGAP